MVIDGRRIAFWDEKSHDFSPCNCLPEDISAIMDEGTVFM